MEVKHSMKTLDFDTRTAVAKYELIFIVELIQFKKAQSGKHDL